MRFSKPVILSSKVATISFGVFEFYDKSQAFSLRSRLESYPDEILFIASRCNRLIGIERQQTRTKMFPNARLEVIEGAGHLMFSDQPAASLAVARRYLSEWKPSEPP